MRFLVGLVVTAIIVAIGAGAFVYSGMYNLAATDQHTAPVYWVLKTVMRRSVQHHARSVHAPPLDDPALIARGRILFHAQCVRCHGAPGVARERFAFGLRPMPANLANTGIEWRPPDLYWAIKHGLKMTGMPAWEFRLRDDQIWAIVAFLQRLPYESPRAYRAALRSAGQLQSQPAETMAENDRASPTNAMQPHAGDAERGRHVLQEYACIVCHEIPGVVGASAPVGPPLAQMGMRSFIAGVLPNTPENMVRWLRAPEKFVPDGAMPDLGVSERDATDMAAYLDSLR